MEVLDEISTHVPTLATRPATLGGQVAGPTCTGVKVDIWPATWIKHHGMGIVLQVVSVSTVLAILLRSLAWGKLCGGSKPRTKAQGDLNPEASSSSV